MYVGLTFPDIVVADQVEAALAALRTSPALLDLMLGRRPPADRDMMRTAIRKRGEAVVRWGLPADTTEDWEVHCMMVQNGNQHVLGDITGALEENVTTGANLLAIIGAEAGIVLPLTAVVQGEPLVAGQKGRVRIGEELALYEVLPTGTVQLTARGVQGTAARAHLDGESVEFHGLVEAWGFLETCAVRVDVISTNGVFTAIMARLLKAFLLARMDEFDQAGLGLGDMTESDLEARPMALPSRFCMRTLTLRLRTTFEVPAEVPIVTDIDFVPVVEGMDLEAPAHAAL